MFEQARGERREQTLGRQVAEILLDCGCIIHGFYKGKSGLVIPLKVEIDKLRQNPEKQLIVARHLKRLSSENFPGHNYLVAVPTGGISLVEGMYEQGRTLPRVRPPVAFANQDTSFQRALNSPFLPNAKIVIVEDVVTKGTSSRKTLKIIKDELKENKISGEVLGEVTIFTYDFVDNINGVDVKALCTWQDLLDALRDRPEDAGRLKYLERWHATVVADIESKKAPKNSSRN